ncbi:hypothetical protein ACEZ3G_12725 [Maribacter algicola]|uniref:Uncharacterized protein n=1 Tax=Meishania litoralis TaxID=3434685 RepID=A0ACC7LKM6_9FLAO
MNKLLLLLLSLSILSCGDNKSSDKKKDTNTSTGINWISFKWIGGEQGGEYYDKLGMEVPLVINDSVKCYAQFDLGANTNMLYESTLEKHTQINRDFIIDTVDTEDYYYWLRNPNIKIGNKISAVKDWIVRNDYDAEGVIGTIGAKEFSERALIIDYVNNRLASLDSIPSEYAKNFDFFDFTIRNNKVILKVLINNQEYDVNFDTGSSITPLLVSNKILFDELTDKSKGNYDLHKFHSWGTTYDTIPGAYSKDNFIINGKDFGKQIIYYLDSDYHRNLFIEDNIDGLLGSILFFKSEILIDFKNKKMGIEVANIGNRCTSP